jgi:hypothetical protein
MMMTRNVIYAKDVMMITGKSRSAANYLLSKIRKAENKEARDFVTVADFSRFMKFTEEEVRKYL